MHVRRGIVVATCQSLHLLSQLVAHPFALRGSRASAGLHVHSDPVPRGLRPPLCRHSRHVRHAGLPEVGPVLVANIDPALGRGLGPDVGLLVALGPLMI